MNTTGKLLLPMSLSEGSGSQILRDVTHRSWRLPSASGHEAPFFICKHTSSSKALRNVSNQVQHFTENLRNAIEHIHTLEHRFTSPECLLSLTALCDLRLFGEKILAERRGAPVLIGAGRQKLNHLGEALFSSAMTLPCHNFQTSDDNDSVSFQLDFRSEIAHSASSSPWLTLIDVLRPDGNDHTLVELTEEFAWRIVIALISTLSFAHAQGLHYNGALACRDVIVRHHHDSCTVDVAVAPPFSLFSISDGDADSALVGQSADVLAAGQIVASLLTSSHFIPNKRPLQTTSQIVPFASVSTDLSLLIRRMIVTSMDQRPSAAQFLEFQAIVLRVRCQLVSFVALKGKQQFIARQAELERSVEALQGKVKALAAASLQPPSERETQLQIREQKLASFLELYELTAATLDGLQINGQSVTALKAMLGAHRASPAVAPSATHLTKASPVTIPPSPVTDSHLQLTSPAPRDVNSNMSHTDPRGEDQYMLSFEETMARLASAAPPPFLKSSASTPPRPTSRPSSALTWNMTAPSAPQALPEFPSPLPKIEMSVDDGTPPHMMHRGHLLTPRHSSPPLTPSLHGANDSIEVIILQDDDDTVGGEDGSQVAGHASAAGSHSTALRRRGHRSRHGGGTADGGDLGDDALGSTAWRDHHFAELDTMQQELHRSSRTTPTKEANSGSILQQKFNQAAARRSPSAGHRIGSRSRSSGASNNSLDREEDPIAVLQRLRAAF
jgi:hypothetical protein